MKYRIVRMQPTEGIGRWAVFIGSTQIARFELKREAVNWIMKKEFPK